MGKTVDKIVGVKVRWYVGNEAFDDYGIVSRESLKVYLFAAARDDVRVLVQHYARYPEDLANIVPERDDDNILILEEWTESTGWVNIWEDDE